MDNERLTALYDRICIFIFFEEKNLNEARSIKDEAYDICMSEGANTDNYKKLSLLETFYSARTEMQCIFNALSEDVSFMDRYKIDWNGFRFAESEMKTAFDRALFDKRWDWDEIGKQLDDFFRSIQRQSCVLRKGRKTLRYRFCLFLLDGKTVYVGRAHLCWERG